MNNFFSLIFFVSEFTGLPSLINNEFSQNSRKLASTKSMTNEGLKCAIDHILDAQQKGEINEDNVLYIVENINVAGMSKTHQTKRGLNLCISFDLSGIPILLLLP